MLLLISINSVARGRGRGCNPLPRSIGMQSMQNTTFLALSKTIFALKTKIASSPIGSGNENVSTLTPDLKRIRSQKSIPGRVKTFSFYCWSSPYFARKTGPNPNEDLFIGLQLSDAKPFQFQLKTVLVWFYTSETDPSLQIPGYAPDLKT